MKIALPLLAFVLAGCSGEEAKEAVAKTVASEESVQPAGKTERVEGIGLFREGNAVHVGDAWESAQKLFPERRSAYRLRTLPDRFGNDFEAHGWETNEGQGYGVITRKDLVVAAIYHADGLEDDYSRGLLAEQREHTGNLPIHEVQSGKASWSFWESGSQRLMVLLYKGAKGTDVTLLMGDAKVLDALGATRPTLSNPSVAPFLTRPAQPSGISPKDGNVP